MQQTKTFSTGHCDLKLVNFEDHDNHSSHETVGLSKSHLVVRRGKPFKITMLFGHQSWSPRSELLVLEVCLGTMSVRIPVRFSDAQSESHGWSAKVYPGEMHIQSVCIHICSPVLSPVGMYKLRVHSETLRSIRSYAVGGFVLLCNPWLKEDPVYMPLESQIEEYIKSDYGLLYMGSSQNVCSRPWSFGQYEPGVLEACLDLLQVSPQHLQDIDRDYQQRADPVYLSRVICAMVNCNDDMGILAGKWGGSYSDGVCPTEWSGSADILHSWVSSKFSPVRYGQCWVFASVLCTVMRVLGIPSRVVTVFDAAHDTDANLTIDEYYSNKGEKLARSKDSIWNFHVWTECWMRRPDLRPGFDGWQVVDATPQEKSQGVYWCGPCPVAAIQQGCVEIPYDSSFIYASVDADIIRLILDSGRVVGRKVVSDLVGQLIYTKSIGTDKAENLTKTYKGQKKPRPQFGMLGNPGRDAMMMSCSSRGGGGDEEPRPQFGMMGNPGPNASMIIWSCREAGGDGDEASFHGHLEETSSSLDVSLSIDGVPSVAEDIVMCVTVTNQLDSPRLLTQHVHAQKKEFNSNPQDTFWKTEKEVRIKEGEVLKLQHIIPASEYESVLVGDDIVNLSVVIKDTKTEESVLAVQEISMSSPEIAVEIEGGDSIEMKKEQTAHVSFTNTFSKTLSGAVLTIEGSGLLQGKHQAKLASLKPGEKIEKKVSITATSPGTKLLKADFKHSNSSKAVSRIFHRISVKKD